MADPIVWINLKTTAFSSVHCQNWKIGRSLIYFEIMSIITHHSQSRNHQKKMSKFRVSREGKVADEIVVNAMTDERKIIWSDCQACGGSDGNIFIPEHTLNQSSIWQINQWRIRCFEWYLPEVDKLEVCPGKVGRHRIEVHFKTVGVEFKQRQQCTVVKGSFCVNGIHIVEKQTEMDQLFKWIKTAGRVYIKILVWKSMRILERNFIWFRRRFGKRYKNAKDAGF
jgi:hypothetical protein